MSVALGTIGGMTAHADHTLEALAGLDAQLGAVLEPALTTGGMSGLTNEQYTRFVTLVESIGRRVDAARLIGAADMATRRTADGSPLRAALGSSSTAEALSRLTRISMATARARTSAATPVAPTLTLTGETIPAPFPYLRAALEHGTIGLDSVTALTTTLGPISARCHPDDLHAAETALVDNAVGTPDTPPADADTIRYQARIWALALDPDGPLPDYERAARKRRLTLGRERDGLIPLTGALLPETAAQLRRLIDAQTSPRTSDIASPTTSTGAGPRFIDTHGQGDGDRTGAGVEDNGGDPGPVDVDDRSWGQKQHDAFAAILSIAARSAESPSIGGLGPALLVTISANDLTTDTGTAFIDGTDQPLPARIARHIACTNGIQHVIHDTNGRILELHSPQRTFTGHQRRAITLRDGECAIPGCHTPAPWCEIHHVTEHAHGGPTHINNGVTLCWYHHRTLDTNGWQIRMSNGLPHVRAPRHLDPEQRWRTVPRSPHLELIRRRSAQTKPPNGT